MRRGARVRRLFSRYTAVSVARHLEAERSMAALEAGAGALTDEHVAEHHDGQHWLCRCEVPAEARTLFASAMRDARDAGGPGPVDPPPMVFAPALDHLASVPCYPVDRSPEGSPSPVAHLRVHTLVSAALAPPARVFSAA